MLLGPHSNHDLGVLLRLVHIPDSESNARPDAAELCTIKAAMMEAMAAHEYYAASYSSKSQPHADGVKFDVGCLSGPETACFGNAAR